MGHQSEKPEEVRVVRHIKDGVNVGRVQSEIIIQPASGITSFHSSLLITTVAFFLFLFKNDLKPPNRSQLLLPYIYVGQEQCMDDGPSFFGKFHVECRSNLFHDFHISFYFHKMNAVQTSGFKWSYRNLKFKTNVSVFVSARNKGDERSSSNYSLSFTTPSCPQMLDDAPDHAICGETIISFVFQLSVDCFAVKCKITNIVFRESIILLLLNVLQFFIFTGNNLVVSFISCIPLRVFRYTHSIHQFLFNQLTVPSYLVLFIPMFLYHF